MPYLAYGKLYKDGRSGNRVFVYTQPIVEDFDGTGCSNRQKVTHFDARCFDDGAILLLLLDQLDNAYV